MCQRHDTADLGVSVIFARIASTPADGRRLRRSNEPAQR
jgi:hypothetical protein